MTKTEFTHMLARRGHMAQKEAERILNAFLDSVEDALCGDGRLDLRGFGAFVILRRKAGQARNPGTGEIVSIPEAKVVKFRPSAALLDILN